MPSYNDRKPWSSSHRQSHASSSSSYHLEDDRHARAEPYKKEPRDTWRAEPRYRDSVDTWRDGSHGRDPVDTWRASDTSRARNTREDSYRDSSSASSSRYKLPEDRARDRDRYDGKGDDRSRNSYEGDKRRDSFHDPHYRDSHTTSRRSSRDVDDRDRQRSSKPRYYDDETRRRSRDIESDRYDRREYERSARSRSRSQERERERSRDMDRYDSERRRSHGTNGSARETRHEPVLLKRKPVDEASRKIPVEEDDDKLESMMIDSRRSNGIHLKAQHLETPSRPKNEAVSESSRWKKLNGDASSPIATEIPHDGTPQKPSRETSSAPSSRTPKLAISDTPMLSFGHVQLPNELPLQMREKNSSISASEEGGKMIVKTAREKGVAGVATKDPRSQTFKPNRLYRTTLNIIRFGWDSNSVGKKPPPPPRTVVLTNLSALTKVGLLLNQIRTYGRIEASKMEMDPKIGQSLGIFSVTFVHDFDEQGRVLGNVASDITPQNGYKVAKTAFQALNGMILHQVKITALLDRNGEVLKQQVKAKMAAAAAKLRPSPAESPVGKTAAAAGASDTAEASPLLLSSPAARGSGTPASSSKYSMAPPDVPRAPRPFASARSGRYETSASAPRNRSSRFDDNARWLGTPNRDDESRYPRSSYDRTMPSPLADDDYKSRRTPYSTKRYDASDNRNDEGVEETSAIMGRLLSLGHSYVFISKPRSSDIVTSDIHASMSQVQPAWIAQGSAGWYVAFDDRNGAHGCKIVTESLTVRGYRLSVEVRTPSEAEATRATVVDRPTTAVPSFAKLTVNQERATYDTGINPVTREELLKTSWTEAELHDAVFRMVQKDLADTYIRDIKSRVISPHITQYLKPSNEGGQILARASVKKVATFLPYDSAAGARTFDTKTSLPSFRKLVSAKPAKAEDPKLDKIRKKSKSKLGSKLLDVDEVGKKRTSSHIKTNGKLRRGGAVIDWSDDDSEMDEDSTEADSRSVSASVEPPSTDGTSIQDMEEEKPKKSRGKATVVSKAPVKKGKAAVPRAAPAKKAAPKPSDPFEAGVVQDAEDLFYLKMALERMQLGETVDEDSWVDEELERQLADELSEGPARHRTDSARTEGYYVIPAAKKAIHLPDRNKASEKEEEHVLQSARNNRADSRRLVLGFEQHKRETATDTDMFKFNQLRTRKKQLKFAKSPIHDWGLYAMELIPAGDMVIEYVGEMIRQQVADEREKQYERQGNFSTYLFRVDDDLVIDATHKGNIARLMNHCCTPNCNAKILTLNGEKRIVLFAKDPIRAGQELTYDYKFQSSADDEDAIACLCGSDGCRHFL